MADVHGELAGGNHEVVGGNIPHRQRVAGCFRVDGNLHLLALASSNENLCKANEALRRLALRRNAEVNLHNILAVHGARVRHGGRDLDARGRARDRDVGKRERGVAQAVTEREGRGDVRGAVAHFEALRVGHRVVAFAEVDAGVALLVAVADPVLFRLRVGGGDAAGGVDLAKQQVADDVAVFHALVPHLEDDGRIVGPRHDHRGGGLQNNNRL